MKATRLMLGEKGANSISLSAIALLTARQIERGGYTSNRLGDIGDKGVGVNGWRCKLNRVADRAIGFLTIAEKG